MDMYRRTNCIASMPATFQSSWTCTSGGTQTPLCIRFLLTMKRHFIALRMLVRLPGTAHACQTCRSCPAISERMWQCTIRHIQACIEFQRRSFSYNLKFVSGHMSIWAVFLALVCGTRQSRKPRLRS
jgi:hypothetical protein